MKPSGAGFVGHVHVRSSSTFCATATHGPPRRELKIALEFRISPVVEGGAQPRIKCFCCATTWAFPLEGKHRVFIPRVQLVDAPV